METSEDTSDIEIQYNDEIAMHIYSVREAIEKDLYGELALIRAIEQSEQDIELENARFRGNGYVYSCSRWTGG